MADYKCKEGMVDNRMVHDTHQEGIKRVMQKHHEKREGHHGKMGVGGKHHGDSFKRADTAKTPRRA